MTSIGIIKPRSKGAGIETDIIKSVPVGKDNAKSAHEIWNEAKPIWAESTFANKLSALVDVGELKRRAEPCQHRNGYQYLYWRSE
jgi:hypothetical protein